MKKFKNSWKKKLKETQNFKAVGGGINTLFTKNNFGFYMKALNTNYKPVFIEFKNIILVLKYFIFCKNFPIQTYGPHIFWGQFSVKF